MSGKRRATEDVDLDMLDATTDGDVARQIAEDQDTAPDMADWDRTPARVVRVRTAVKPKPERTKPSNTGASRSANFGRRGTNAPAGRRQTPPKSSSA